MSRIINPFRQEPAKVEHSHIVPRFYLNKFADSNKFIWVHEIGKKPWKASTRGICWERNYFSYRFGRQRIDGEIESFLSVLESSSAKVYPKIVAGSTLSQEETMIWAAFVSTLFLRSRKVRNQLASSTLHKMWIENSSDDFLSKAQHDLFAKGHLIAKDEILAAVNRVTDQLDRNPAFAHLNGFDERWIKLATTLGDKNWFTVDAATDSTFMTSDCPVITMKLPGDGKMFLGYGFGQEDVAVVLPLTPKKLFIASPKNLGWVQVLDHSSTRLFNKAVAQFAEKRLFALTREREHIEVVNEGIGGIVYGENAFCAPKSPEVR